MRLIFITLIVSFYRKYSVSNVFIQKSINKLVSSSDYNINGEIKDDKTSLFLGTKRV